MKQVALQKMGDYIYDVIVPHEEVLQFPKKGSSKPKPVRQKIYQGYLLINCYLLTPYDTDNHPYDKVGKHTLVEQTWYFLQGCPGVIRFAGVTSHEDKPMPMTFTEVQDVFQRMKTVSSKLPFKIDFELGESVVVLSGPFRGSHGRIEKLFPDKGKIEVAVPMFGRLNPVELKYNEVERP